LEILSELEAQPRGLYTGAIGYLAPDGSLSFNVAIRTAVVNHQSNTVEFGIGSGIVWDSVAADEYAECLLKGSVLGRRPIEFDLLETMVWTGHEGFVLLDRHLQRMRESADYFDFPYDEVAVRRALPKLESTDAEQKWRIRLLLSRSGEARAEQRPLDPSSAVLNVGVAAGPIDVDDPFLFHKTTHRSVYERARSAVSVACDEVILWNRSGEVTEATTANVVVERDGMRVTPPVRCGLLPGTFRAEILARGEVREAVVALEELRSAPRFWLVNSVHGWRDARLITGPGQVGPVGQ
jgi:para-aminobenzoate synthetase/4-amino-4-deoxychorismate lyase